MTQKVVDLSETHWAWIRNQYPVFRMFPVKFHRPGSLFRQIDVISSSSSKGERSRAAGTNIEYDPDSFTGGPNGAANRLVVK
jgi:hypothetical protein